MHVLEIAVTFDDTLLGVHHLAPGESLRVGPPEEAPDYALADLAGTLRVESRGLFGIAHLPDGEVRELSPCAASSLHRGGLDLLVRPVVLEQRTVPRLRRFAPGAHRHCLAPILVSAALLGLGALVPPAPRLLLHEGLTSVVAPVIRLSPASWTAARREGPGPDPLPSLRPAARRQVPARWTFAEHPEVTSSFGDDHHIDGSHAGDLHRGFARLMEHTDEAGIFGDAGAVLEGLVAQAGGPYGGGFGAGLVDSRGGDAGETVPAGLGGFGAGTLCGPGTSSGCTLGAIGYGRQAGTFRGHRPAGPDVVPGTATVCHVSAADARRSCGLSKDLIRRVVRASIPAYRACYERRLQADPALGGRVMLAFTIGPTGDVMAARSTSAELEDEAVLSCTAGVTRRLRFSPQGPGLIEVTYPLVFQAGGPL